MDYFEWNHDLSVGIDEIDEGHIKWISFLNELYEGIEKGKDPSSIESLLNNVITYSKGHFKREEELFAESDYPDTVYHKKLHDHYLEELEKLREQYHSGDRSVVSTNVMISMKKWFVEHIQVVDKQSAPYILRKKTG